ncbi:polysaccharide biosynthesis/export family protein [Parabacteroides sp.]
MNKSACFSQLLLLPIVGLLILFSACSSMRQTTYFQDLTPGETELKASFPLDIKVQPEDQISILVSSRDPQLTSLFNLPIISQQVGQASLGGGSSRGLAGYTVDARGEIDFPVLGKLPIAGKSRSEIAVFIKDKLISGDYVKDPVVTVEFMNLKVSVLGEVNRPGRFNIDRNQMTLLDAISLAGDLTIYGKRDRVMVLREENGAQRVYGVNLCSANQMYSSPAYYLQQNDVVYVEPNSVRSRQSTLNGNNVRTTTFWLSLASFLTTIGVLIFK